MKRIVSKIVHLLPRRAATLLPVTLFCVGLGLSTQVFAVDVIEKNNSGFFQQATSENIERSGRITNIINILLFVVGVVAVIGIIIGGIRYTTSNGDASQTKAAKDIILYAVVGLIAALLAWAIVTFVLDAFA